MIFKDAFNLWFDFYKNNVGEKRAKYVHSLFINDLVELHHLKINNIRPKLILDLLNAVDKGNKRKIMKMILINVYGYLCAIDAFDNNPAERVSKYIYHHEFKGFNTILDENKLGKMLKSIFRDRGRKSSAAVNALLVIIFTAKRRQEVMQAKWSEIDFDNKIWTIPSERMKTKREHIFPISETVLSILAEQKKLNKMNSEYIFVGRNKDKPLYDSAPYTWLQNNYYIGEQTLHGFRKTFSTFAHDSGLFSVDAIEVQLSHAIKDVRGIYNKASYIKERRKLMQWYDELLHKIKS